MFAEASAEGDLMIFYKAIPEIEKAIGYKFKDKSLLMQAFTRTSFCNETKGSEKEDFQSNEVLEFLGDSALSTAIITNLLSDKGKRYSHGLRTALDEGDFSNIKSNLSDKKNLSKSMRTLGLQKYLIMGEGDSKQAIENEPSVMEDLFESIIGAVYLDCDMNIKTVMNTVSKMLDVSEYISGDAINRSSKNELQEWCADKARRLPPPRYETESEAGPDHKKTYVRACYVGERLLGRGEGKNLKTADANAAKTALQVLKAEADAAFRKKAASKPKAAAQADPKTKIRAKSVKEEAKKSQKAENQPRLADPNAQKKLKDFAKSNGLPSPEFRDLGETDASSTARKVYRIECRLKDKTVTADAFSKSDARAFAAEDILLALTEKKTATKKIAQSNKIAKNHKK